MGDGDDCWHVEGGAQGPPAAAGSCATPPAATFLGHGCRAGEGGDFPPAGGSGLGQFGEDGACSCLADTWDR